MEYLSLFVVLFVVSIILTYVIKTIDIYERPVNNRWSYKLVPSLGGLVFLLGSFYIFRETNVVVASLWVLLFVVSLLDDLCEFAPIYRLVVHISCGLGIFFVYLVESSSWIVGGFSIVFVVMLINAMNFIDNMDGLGAGTAFIASLFLLALYRDPRILFLTVVLSGFLIFNLPPAKIYMGDCGSTVIGFILAWYCLCHDQIYWMKNFFILVVPLVDITFVTITRVIRKQKPWIGDTTHLSHRLSRMFNSDRKAIGILYGVGLIGGVIGLLV